MPLWYLSDIARDIVYYDRGRDAIWGALGLSGLRPGEAVLVPAYLCPAVIQPIKKGGFRLKFYRVGKDMTVDLKDLADKICPGTKALLVIHYFGFPQPMSEIARICRERNLFLIEDCAHVLASRAQGRYLGSFGDAAAFSFKKPLWFMPGRGAALLINNPGRRPPEFKDAQPAAGACRAGIAKDFYRGIMYSILRYKAARFFIDRIIGLTDFIRLRPRSRINGQYLDRIAGLELAALIARCRDNFNLFLDNIGGCKGAVPVFPSLPTDVCPMGFPVFVDNRDAVFSSLLKNGIRPFILWEFLPPQVKRKEFPDADYISRHILVFPVSGVIDIKKICAIVNSR